MISLKTSIIHINVYVSYDLYHRNHLCDDDLLNLLMIYEEYLLHSECHVGIQQVVFLVPKIRLRYKKYTLDFVAPSNPLSGWKCLVSLMRSNSFSVIP